MIIIKTGIVPCIYVIRNDDDDDNNNNNWKHVLFQVIVSALHIRDKNYDDDDDNNNNNNNNNELT
jgi:hypothetical protein